MIYLPGSSMVKFFINHWTISDPRIRKKEKQKYMWISIYVQEHLTALIRRRSVSNCYNRLGSATYKVLKRVWIHCLHSMTQVQTSQLLNMKCLNRKI